MEKLTKKIFTKKNQTKISSQTTQLTAYEIMNTDTGQVIQPNAFVKVVNGRSILTPYVNYTELTREEKILNKVLAVLTKAACMCPGFQPYFWEARDIFIEVLDRLDANRVKETRYDNYKKLYYAMKEKYGKPTKRDDKVFKFRKKKMSFSNLEKREARKNIISDIEKIAGNLD